MDQAVYSVPRQAASARDGRGGGRGVFNAFGGCRAGIGFDAEPGVVGIIVFVQGGVGNRFAVAG